MNQKLRNLVYTAMLIALCCVATLVIKIPTVTGGYLNAGDIVVVLAALLAGPLYGGVKLVLTFFNNYFSCDEN